MLTRLRACVSANAIAKNEITSKFTTEFNFYWHLRKSSSFCSQIVNKKSDRHFLTSQVPQLKLTDRVTSVSQLADVQPSDWAYLTLTALFERYGVAGYPDGTWRGNRALTRYEFAAGLQATRDRINQLINAGSAEQIRREDLATLLLKNLEDFPCY